MRPGSEEAKEMNATWRAWPYLCIVLERSWQPRVQRLQRWCSAGRCHDVRRSMTALYTALNAALELRFPLLVNGPAGTFPR